MSNSDQTAKLKGGAQALVAPESYNVSCEACPQEPAIHKSERPADATHERPGAMKAGMRSGSKTRLISAILAILGLASVGAALAMGPAAQLSIILSIAGIGVLLSAILLLLVSPYRLVRGDVCDAEAISCVELIGDMLMPLAGESKGIYMPASHGRPIKVFIPARGELVREYGKGDGMLSISVSGMEGMLITPPGYSLLEHARSLGAAISAEGMESDIADILAGGMELASGVEVKRDGDSVRVRLHGIAGTPMCRSIRQKKPMVCYQAGCPICSFVACMVTEGTGKPLMVSAIKAEGKDVNITYTLLG